MKSNNLKILSGLLSLILLLNLCACGWQKTPEIRETVPGVDPQTGEWVGEGECYTVAKAELPDYCQQTFWLAGEQYYLLSNLNTFQSDLCRGERVIYHEDDFIDTVFPTSDSIWRLNDIRQEDGRYAELKQLSPEGTEKSSFSFKYAEDDVGRQFAVDTGLLYLNTMTRIHVFTLNGEKLAEIPHSDWAGRLVKDASGGIWFADEREQGGGRLFRMVPEKGALELQFTYDAGQICTGDSEAPFFLIQGDRISRLQMDGAINPMIIWSECGYSISGVHSVLQQPDGSYLIRSTVSNMTMRRANPSELKARTRLTVGVLGDAQAFARTVFSFNAESEDCYVQIVDLTDDGSLSEDQALLRLNTQILSGEGPDMLLFRGSFTPFPYIHRGLLREMSGDIENDPDITLEDIIPAKAIRNDFGGIYLLGGGLDMETRVGLQSRFGFCCGWSFDRYREIDQSMPQGTMVMYNLDKEYFFRNAMSRYIRSAVDWQNSSCDFDNESFIRVLEACRTVHETPEDPNNMVYGTGGTLLNGGYLATDLCGINTVVSLARISRGIGSPISVIGFPSPDGSCGTDFAINNSVGILNGTKHPELCWKFVKDCLLHESVGIPAYRPNLEKEIRDAEENAENTEDVYAESLTSPMTQSEAQQLRELLSQVEHTTFCDEKILEIVREEFAAVDAGDRSAAEAAALVQSRVSLYVSEQKS